MIQTVFGERFLAENFDGSLPKPVIYQPFTLPETTRVKAIRTAFVIYGNPTFTGLSGKIYANQGGVPTTLIHTSNNSWANTDLLTEWDHGYKEIYFEFTNPIFLKGETLYHFAIDCSVQTFTYASHVAWVRGYPDPNTTHDMDIIPRNLGNIPFYFAMIGAPR